MQYAAISLHCVMLLAPLGFLEFPPFSYASHILPKTQAEAHQMNGRYKKKNTNTNTLLHCEAMFGHDDTRFLMFL